ncbi:hypothetical protein KZZ52_51650 [Dactylosporangium sp. AC04546]|uniref:hypothetical protein n=1 Tax=Dactylosporangium sp. AC04546 TaxID=2862460 RepID=UPI001EDFA3B2|nr:hypothetical protein [Dactylosporangium sp. AC04546]WVK82317.1 hypothetical protein KZZ52_51650 [Dactylosporangium sp. AC04546]
MTEQYAGALLYLVPVVVAAVVAFVVTRPAKDDVAAAPAPPAPPRVPVQRSVAPVVNRRMPAQPPTLLHAALSSHLAAVSGAPAPAPGTAPPAPAVRRARLVSIRRPARIPRRPIHRCPRSS